ncbi:hypothetical protein B0H17DRAFT_1139306 [Mycena rosella]|uniref:Uncharacterized protein n=1 Tax=Mycena rosella TaxID=1033263 RepID=A0AAD7G8W4_MYCRO|nr:hypothetical protein B0H17DRAFT_1139306 [Mycena rosella]
MISGHSGLEQLKISDAEKLYIAGAGYNPCLHLWESKIPMKAACPLRSTHYLAPGGVATPGSNQNAGKKQKKGGKNISSGARNGSAPAIGVYFGLGGQIMMVWATYKHRRDQMSISGTQAGRGSLYRHVYCSSPSAKQHEVGSKLSLILTSAATSPTSDHSPSSSAAPPAINSLATSTLSLAQAAESADL